MNNSKTQNDQVNLQGKLRLQRSNSDSLQGISDSSTNISSKNEAKPQEVCSNNPSRLQKDKSKSKDNMENSMAEFMMPKKEIDSSAILNRFKIDAEKPRRQSINSKVKPTTKSKKSTRNQSIESLLKAQHSNQNQIDIKEAVPCPVCLKPFKDDDTCTSHMKACAAKNNVSIKQLLEAKRLQDRQAEERKAIGLSPAPMILEKKKAFQSKKFSTGDDPQLQLVLAMSESLYEAQRMVELEEAAFLAGIPKECIREMNDEERKKTLQSFGFTTNKPQADVPATKHRKKKLHARTILQTRSKEDKDRVLTERIACILTGEDALTQGNPPVINRNDRPSCIINGFLKKIEKTDDKLWDQSRLTKQSHDFYVNTLKSHFVKSGQQPVESEIHESLTEDHRTKATQAVDASIVYEPMDLDVIMNEQIVADRDNLCEMPNANEMISNNFEFDLVQDLANSWKEVLNDSSASDVLIFVKNDKHVYAHTLVFRTQCSNMLLDIEPLDTALHPLIKNKISWLDKEQISALAFLEFIYSGTISRYASIFHQEELVQQVEQLARLYKKQNLFTYIRRNKQKLKCSSKDSEQLENSNNIQDELAQSEMQVEQENRCINADDSADVLIPKQEVPQQLIDRRITTSPDLFDSEDDEAHCSKTNIKSEINNEQDSDNSQHSQRTIVNLSRSVSPLENIHEAVTPPLCQSPIEDSKERIFDEREIAEALTPKRQSPETIVKAEQEMGESEDLALAVTPERVSPTELDDYGTPNKSAFPGMEVQDVEAHIDESIYTAVTPPRLQEEPIEVIDEDPPKIKSELTMFIEKVQRKNAQCIMDTDSETDSPAVTTRPKNIFSKRYQDDSYKYLRNDRDQKYHKAISLLEKDVLDDEKARKNHEDVESGSSESIKNASELPKNANASTSKPFENVSLDSPLNSADSEIEDVTADPTEISMYSKYKKSNKSNNSISYYRKQLSFHGPGNAGKADEINDSGASTRGAVSPPKKPKPRIIEDITLVSDSEEEEHPLKTFLRDKSKKKVHRSSPCAYLNEGEEKVAHKLVDEPFNGGVSKLQSEAKVIDLSVDSDEAGTHDESAFPNGSLAQSDRSSNSKSLSTMELQSSKSKLKELEEAAKRSEDIDAEISEILELSQKTPSFSENWSMREQNESQKSMINLSSKKSNNHSLNSQSSLELGENGDLDLLAVDISEVKTPPAESVRDAKVIEARTSSSVKRLSYGGSSPDEEKAELTQSISSPILSQNRRISRRFREESEVKVKSASSSALGIRENGGSSLQRSSSPIAHKVESSSDEHENTTAPLDYSLLDTPKLQDELKKFGLKPQSRVKAKALLKHIQRETQSQPSASQKRTFNSDSSSEQDEPPAKRQYDVANVEIKKKSDTNAKSCSKTEKRSDNGAVIAEEMDFDDPDVANIFESSVSIRDAFFKLIKTNKELYNKVLTYEPLPLELLHSTLKQNGFKCKINSLMDFLDEQCITFQVKAKKGDRKENKMPQ